MQSGGFDPNPFDNGYVGTVETEIVPVVNPPREVFEQATAVIGPRTLGFRRTAKQLAGAMTQVPVGVTKDEVGCSLRVCWLFPTVSDSEGASSTGMGTSSSILERRAPLRERAPSTKVSSIVTAAEG